MKASSPAVAKKARRAVAVTDIEVCDNGELVMANYPDAETRADCYGDIGGWCLESPDALLEAMDSCRPLAWQVEEIYTGILEEFQSQLWSAETEEKPDRKKLAALKARLRSMPESSEKVIAAWVRKAEPNYFKTVIVGRIEQWLAGPCAGEDSDYVPPEATARGAAAVFFEGLDPNKLDEVGVAVVEGEHPGSSYYAAHLELGIEEANAAAKKAKLPVRFIAASNDAGS